MSPATASAASRTAPSASISSRLIWCGMGSTVLARGRATLGGNAPLSLLRNAGRAGSANPASLSQHEPISAGRATSSTSTARAAGGPPPSRGSRVARRRRCCSPSRTPDRHRHRRGRTGRARPCNTAEPRPRPCADGVGAEHRQVVVRGSRGCARSSLSHPRATSGRLREQPAVREAGHERRGFAEARMPASRRRPQRGAARCLVSSTPLRAAISWRRRTAWKRSSARRRRPSGRHAQRRDGVVEEGSRENGCQRGDVLLARPADARRGQRRSAHGARRLLAHRPSSAASSS